MMRLNRLVLLSFLALSFMLLTGMGTAQRDSAPGNGPRSEVEAAVKAGLPVFVEAGSAHCEPCKKMAPVIDSIKKKYAGRLKVVYADYEKHKNYCDRLGVISIPTQILIGKDGKVVDRHMGGLTMEEAEKFIGKVLK